MKFAAMVIGHKLVTKNKREACEVLLEGCDEAIDKVKVKLTVDREDRDDYPIGSGCVVDFDVQQALKLKAAPARS